MAGKFKFSRVVTPRAITKFAWLDKPDMKYKENGEYKTRLLFDDTEETREWIDGLLKLGLKEAKEAGLKIKKKYNNPFKFPEDMDEEDYLEDDEGKVALDEDHKGRIFVDVKTGFKPSLIDSQRKDLPEGVKIFGGDIVKAKLELNPYEGLGSGISLRLVTVQLIEKNTSFTSGGPDTSGFEDEEGGYVAPARAEDEEDDF